MKTAISIPDEVFEGAEQAAKTLGVSRSELYATAVREYVERYRREDVTEKLNEIYAGGELTSELDLPLKIMQIQSLKSSEWK